MKNQYSKTAIIFGLTLAAIGGLLLISKNEKVKFSGWALIVIGLFFFFDGYMNMDKII